MRPLSFTYKDKDYKGFIEAHTQEYPFFYWCFLDDPELAEEIGVCITFKQTEDGKLTPTDLYPGALQELVEIVKGIVEHYIQAGGIT